MPIHDSIGVSYIKTRCADPRIVDAIVKLLGLPGGSLVADIGAGTGNYTNALADRGYRVAAVEPPAVMRNQATPHQNVTWLDGDAEQLPLADGSVDAVTCTLASHHFPNLAQAFREIDRVANNGPLLIFTFDYSRLDCPWFGGYFPTIWNAAVSSISPLPDSVELMKVITERTVEIVPLKLPSDLKDMFLLAGWQRLEVYLDPNVRAGMSIFATGNDADIAAGVARLQSDLESGRWDEQHGSVRKLTDFDAGYYFILAAG